MKRIIALFLMIILITFCIPVSFSASAVTFVDYGNVNYLYDDEVDALDATMIQRYIASLTDFDGVQKEAADYDHDGEISMIDVTLILRSVAQINIPKYCGGSFEYMSSVTHLYADFESGKAIAGAPVTFTADEGRQIDDSFQPIEYRFEIFSYADKNEPIAVRDYSQENSFTYTFDSADIRYEIDVYSRNRYGYVGQMRISSYQVIEPYTLEQPVITSVYSNQYGNKELFYSRYFHTSIFYKNMTFFTVAKGGSGDYQYAFEYKTEKHTLTQDYSEDNSFTVDRADFPGWEESSQDDYDWRDVQPNELIVHVKDSTGNQTTETYLVAAIDDVGAIG